MAAQDKKPTWPGGFNAAVGDEQKLREEYAAFVEEQRLRQEYDAYVASLKKAPALAAEDRAPAAPTLGEKAAYAGKSFARGAVESTASTLTGMGMMGGGLARLGGETPPQLQVTPQQFADYQQRFTQQYAPDRDPRFAGSLLESAPEAFGSTVPFAIGGAAGGSVAISALGAAAAFSSGYYDALAETGDAEKAFEAGWKNAPSGLLEAIPLGGQVARFLGRANRATGGSLGRVMATALVEGSENAAQEVVQRGWQDAVAKYVMEYDTDREMLVGALRQDALPAFLVGAVLGGLSSVGQVPPDVAEKYGVQPQPVEPAPGEVGPGAMTTDFASLVQDVGQTTPVEAALGVAQQQVTADKIEATAAPAPADLAPPAVAAQEPAAPQSQPVAPQAAPAPSVQPAPAQAAVEPTAPPQPPATRPATQPAAAQPPQAEPPGPTTGIKNRTVDAELEKMGLPPAEHGEAKTDREVYGKAKEKFDADPFSGARLVQELADANRPPTDDEIALLTFEVNRLTNEREAAEAAYNLAPTAENQARIDRAVAEYAAAANVVTMAGTEQSRAFRLRRMMLARDYSLAAMERRAVAANGGFALSKEQTDELAKSAARLKELQDKLAKVQAEAELRQATQEAELAFLRMQKNAGKGRKRVERTKRIAESKARIGALESELSALMRGQANALVDPRAVAIIFKLAAEYARVGALTFAQWSSTMVERHGPAVEPHLEPAWEQARKSLREERGAVLRERAQTGRELKAQRPLILKIAEGFVEDGITEREALVDAVHEVVKESYPDATRRQVMDAISGYGEFKTLSDDEVKRQLRDIRGQLQQVAKLEDLQAKLAPKKTGVERRTPSKEERRLIQQVNEAKRRSGIRSSGPDTLKTIEDSLKTRLQNQIDDLQYQIDNKTQIVRDRTKTQPSAEVMALREKRDALKQEFDALFKDPQADAAKRIEAAKRATERSIAEYERRIAAGETAAKQKQPGPTSAELDALRARRDALKAELDEMRAAQEPKVSQEERDLKAFKRRKLNELARLQERVFYGEFEDPRPSPRKKREIVLDQEAIQIEAQLEAAKRQSEVQIERFKYENRTRLQEVRDAALEALNLQKQLVSSYDLGALLRQGAIPSAAHPVLLLRRWVPKMVRAVKSEADADLQMATLRKHPLYPVFERSGGKLTDPSGVVGQREEFARSKLAERIPGIKGSNRAFLVLNWMRMDLFAKMYESMPNTPSPEEARGLANAVMLATGVGDPGKGVFARVMNSAGYILWSPSLLLSRVQMLTLNPLRKAGSNAARKVIAKELARSLAGLAAYYMLANVYGALRGGDDDEKVSITFDPRSSDYGKVVIGNTRIDPLAGLSQALVIISRIVSGDTVNAEGEVIPIRGIDRPFGQKDVYDYLADFVRSKLHPSAGLAANVMVGEDLTGEEFRGWNAVGSVTLPISFRETKKAIEEHGFAEGSALSLLSILGQGMSVYDTPEERAEKRAERERSR